MRASGLLALLIGWATAAPIPVTAIGFTDFAGDANGNTSIQKGGMLFVRGWAADISTGAPVSRVLVYLDGSTYLGDATLGGIRNDVAQAYSRTDFLASGWSFQGSTAAFTVGTHTITAVANGPSTSAPLTGSKTINITSAPGSGQLIGNVDTAADGSGNTTLPKGGTLLVRGWAADVTTGAPVSRVQVFLDGSTYLGDAVLGGVRNDVAQAYNRSDFLASGWSFQGSTAAFTEGTHTITAVANGPSTSGPLTGSKTINVTASSGAGLTIGFVDTAGDANGLASIIKGNNLFVRGWAADSVGGAPVLSVTVFVDGFGVGVATLGLSRPDVAQAFGSPSFQNSGWTFQFSTGTLSTGSHTITAVASGTSGSAQLTGSKIVNVTAQAAGQETGFVDVAGDSNGGVSLVQGATVFVQGWAADTATGAPVQTVTVFIDGAMAGTATLGIVRADVATATSRSDFTSSGWTFQMSTGALSVGAHMVTATATGPSGSGALVGTKTFNVTAQAAAQVIGVVDSATAQGSTITIRGWAADLVAGAPVQVVSVLVDNTFTVFATLGVPRPDVAAAYNRQDFANSGWTTQVSFGLAQGSHNFTATATGASGTGPLMGVQVLTFP